MKMWIKKNRVFLVVLALLFGVLLYFSVISPIILLTDDEAYNYFVFSRHGALYAITQYNPNNHVFFTLLQTFIPKIILPFFPHALRLLNVFYGVLFFVFLYFFFTIMKKTKKESKNINVFTKVFAKNGIVPFLLITLILLFASPVASSYFFTVRGYLLGMLLLLLGMYVLCVRKYHVASALFILSGWTVPTFMFALPLIYIILFFSRRRSYKKIILSALLVLLGLVVCYLPIISMVLSQSKVFGYSSSSQFSTETWWASSNFEYIPYGPRLQILLVIAYLLSLMSLIKEKMNKKVRLFLVLLNTAAISYFAVVFLLFAAHFSNLPYTRNGYFTTMFVLISMFSMAFITKMKWLKIYLFTILIFNACAGFYLVGIKLQKEPGISNAVFHFSQSTISKSTISSLQLRKLKYIIAISEHDPIMWYFSDIYSIPTKIVPPKQP